MGLDITAYKDVTFIGKQEDDEDWPDDVAVARTNDDFPGRENDIVDCGKYSYADEFGFRAGSYGSYGDWRRQLAELVGVEADAVWLGRIGDCPFLELINFSDCEGVLGAETCAKLLSDFEAWDEKASGKDEYFYELYKDWTKAMRFGSDNGFVDFH